MGSSDQESRLFFFWCCLRISDSEIAVHGERPRFVFALRGGRLTRCAVFSAGTSQEDIHDIHWQSPSMTLATLGRNMFWPDVGRVASHRTSQASNKFLLDT